MPFVGITDEEVAALNAAGEESIAADELILAEVERCYNAGMKRGEITRALNLSTTKCFRSLTKLADRGRIEYPRRAS
jgi:DNA-binding transcriptional regulator LsrR (DeoR family)